jgi:Domain of unknown function (DUF6048)
MFVAIFTLCGNSQELPQDRTYGVRIGFDASRIPLYFKEPKIKGLELSIDIEAVRNFYPVLELGFGSLTIDKENFFYDADNQYVRLGFDYNILKPDIDDPYGMGYIGIRYGYSSFNYNAKNIVIPNPYWGEDIITEIEKNHLNIHWIEIVAGIKAEIFPNFFVGWSIRGRFMLYKTEDENMDPSIYPDMVKESQNPSWELIIPYTTKFLYSKNQNNLQLLIFEKIRS